MSDPGWLAELVDGNARFAASSGDGAHAAMPSRPTRRLAVVACMDTRHIVEQALGLEPGEAVVVRTAGPLAETGVRRSLKVAVHALGVERVVVMGHSDCGMTKLSTIGDLAERVAARAELPEADITSTALADRWGAFDDAADNIRAAVGLIRADPELPRDLDVRGLMYDNASGTVRALP